MHRKENMKDDILFMV